MMVRAPGANRAHTVGAQDINVAAVEFVPMCTRLAQLDPSRSVGKLRVGVVGLQADSD